MISPEEEMKLYRLLEEKLEKVAESVGYWEQPSDSEEHRRLEGAWRSYLAALGIHVVPNGTQPGEDVYMSADPLYTTGDRLILPWDVVDKILVVGLP